MSSLSLTPGVWECRNCRTKNVRKLERCSRCDCVNPQLLSPVQSSAVRSGGHELPAAWARSSDGGSTTFHYADPVDSRMLPPPRPSMSPVRHHSLSPPRAAAEASNSPRRPNRSLDALFSPLPTASSAQRTSSASPLSHASLHSQLTQAIAAHRSLMREYSELNTLCDRSEETIDRLRKDLVALDAVYRSTKKDLETARGHLEAERASFTEDRRRLEQRCERLEREVHEREVLWRAKADLIESLQKEKDTALQELRDAHTNERTRWNERVCALESDFRELQADYKSQQSQHTSLLSEQQRLFAAEREQYTGDSQKLLHEMTASHQCALKQMSDEVSNAKDLSSMLAKRERDMLLERVEHEQQMRMDADRRRERETSDARLELERVRQTLEGVTKQRDELLSEATFQLEIVSELRTEKAACKAELAALRISTSERPTYVGALPLDVHSTLRAPTRTMATSPPPQLQSARDESEINQLKDEIGCHENSLAEARAHILVLEGTLEQLRAAVLEEKSTCRHAAEQQRRGYEERIEELQLQLAAVAASHQPCDATTPLTEKLAELQTSLDNCRNDLDDEVAMHEETKRRHDDDDAQHQQRLRALTHRVEELQNALADQQSENSKLVEECDALRISLEDMEQSLADALAAALR